MGFAFVNRHPLEDHLVQRRARRQPGGTVRAGLPEELPLLVLVLLLLRLAVGGAGLPFAATARDGDDFSTRLEVIGSARVPVVAFFLRVDMDGRGRARR